MNKHVTLSILFFLCFFIKTNAQCPPAGEPVPGDGCVDAQTVCELNDYCYTLSFNNVVQTFPGCTGFVLNNDEWINFVAGTPSMTLEIVPSNCLGLNGSSANSGMQAAVYAGDCNNLIPVALQCSCTLDPFTLQLDNLVPGQTYYFVADGCAGDICEYTIHVQQGNIQTGNGGLININPQTAGICGGQSGTCESACSFSQTVYTVDTAFPVDWVVTGADSFSVQGNVLTVLWGEPGLGEIIASADGQGCLEDGYLCIDILPNPEAKFTTLPLATGDIVEICQGQTVFFENLSEGATNYIWDFGNGSYSADAHPSFSFENPGLQKVYLIAKNECACTDTTEIEVKVLASQAPEIECVATTCQGDIATYSTNANCSVYNWELNGSGVIIEGGETTDNYMTVEWTGDDGGTIGLSVSGCQSNTCLIPTVIEAPILNNDIPISGPANVCPGEKVVYSIPPFDGSAKSWVVSNMATIVEGQGTSSLVVEWNEQMPPNLPQQYVRVKVDNCWLDCEGFGEKEVNITPKFSIQGEIEVCENTQAVFRSKAWPDIMDVPCFWTVRNEFNIDIWNSTTAADSVVIDLNFGGGRYTIEAVPANQADVCTGRSSLYFNVVNAPPIPEDILGPTEICPGEWVSYSVASAAQGANFIWEVENGLDVEIMNGHTINVQWGVVPIYNLAVRHVSEGSLGCLSDPFLKSVQPLNNVLIQGEDVLCTGETGEYEAFASDIGTFNWSISPSNMGTIITGQGTENIHVFWENPGIATIETNYCGIFQSFQVTVNEGNEPNIDHPTGICVGETAPVQVLDNLNFIVWQNAAGSVIGNGDSINVEAGNYLITGVNEDGCKVHKVIEIKQFFEPTASISTGSYMPLCPGGPGVTITALQNESGLTFQWLHEGSPIGTNSPTLWTNDPGTYEVIVTNPGGCAANSDEIEIITCEMVGGICDNGQCIIPDTCQADGTIGFNAFTTGNCNEIQFQNFSTGFVPGSMLWNFGDPASGNNSSTDYNTSHVYSTAGNYTAWLYGLYPNLLEPGTFCLLADSEDIKIPALADFDVDVKCFGTPTEFTSSSAFLPSFNVVGWEWNFGDPSSGWQNTSNLQHPDHIYSQPGNYAVMLTITMSSGCQVSNIEFISIPGVPDIDFVSPGSACTGTAVAFNGDLPLVAADVEWNFGDWGSGSSNTSKFEETYHAFSGAGNYDVTLTMTTISGCTNSVTHPVQVSDNNLGGSITGDPSGAVCQGDSVMLSAPPGAAQFEWSTGETTPEIDVWFTGVFNLTLTDANGCVYIPPGYPTQVMPVPVGEIQAVEYDEFGQPINFFFDYYEVCEGEDVTVMVTSLGENTHTWSTGDTTELIQYTHDHDGTLAAGEYEFYNTITSTVTGCTTIVGPLNIDVHEGPDSFQIVSNPPPPLCNLTPIDMTIVQPDPDLDYYWSSGETGTLITTLFPGEYFSFAVNQQGCKGYSNDLFVSPGPDPLQVPSGCHTRCDPDTMCLPDLPNVVSYQWFYEGQAIPAPMGNIPDLVATESGDYYVEMIDDIGCPAVSGTLTLDLYPGFGDFTGLVYFDVNENGIIDAGDTLMSNIDIQLLNGNNIVETYTTDQDGNFLFLDIPANDYTVQLDTNSLILGQGIEFYEFDEEIEGCDQEAEFAFLVFPVCITRYDTLTLTGCEGTVVPFNGQDLVPGSIQNFNFQSWDECDSIVTVQVVALPVDYDTVYLATCEGTTIAYDGNDLAAGSEHEFTYVNEHGCDSIVTVYVDEYLHTTSDVDLEACKGETVIFQGQSLAAGSTQEFTISNQLGCDSTITVFVETLALDTNYVDLDVCPNETIEFSGQTFSEGDFEEIIMTNEEGCDSSIFVAVEQYPESVLSITSDESCPNEPTGAIQLTATGSAGYTYSLDNDLFQSEPLFENLGSGPNIIYVMDENGCMTIGDIEIGAYDELQGILENETLPCESNGITLTPLVLSGQFSPLSYVWQDGSTNPQMSLNAPGLYEVEISNICETMAMSAEVVFEDLGDRNYFYVPNSFSPNYDGINDLFKVYPRQDLEILSFEFQVFDRWGDQFFVTSDVLDGWNGMNRNKMLQPGVFVWWFRAEVEYCGRVFEIFEKGGVHLVR